MVSQFILYKIYYQHGLVYLGRTKQPLQSRIRGHLFKKPMHREIDINSVTRIEYATFPTEADMNVYEIYLINLLKPPLNRDDKAGDELTVTLPEVKWELFTTQLWGKWKARLDESKAREEARLSQQQKRYQQIRELRDKCHTGEITEEEYYAFREGGFDL